MTDIRIHNPVQNEFAMVPNVLWTWPGLSFKAKAFMAYLLQFRHGSCPPVAAMERDTGLGRDARQAVMLELREAGLADWEVQRNAAGRVVAKVLEVTTVPLLAATLARAQGADHHAPENPVHGVHTPEKPSDGFSGPKGRKIRSVQPENPAILKRKNKDIEPCGGLSDFQKGRLLSGQSVPMAGRPTVLPGSPEFHRLRLQVEAERLLVK